MATPIPENRARFSLPELERIVGARNVRQGSASEILGVSTDTRADLRQRLFVALVGERFDGHDYLEDAVAAGAAALIVSDADKTAQSLDALSRKSAERPWVFEVEDTLQALGALALFHRSRCNVRVLAVAGSAGKTTTRSACSALCEQMVPGRVHSTRGNLNNRIGVPMTLLALEPRHRFAVIEIGTNAPGEVRALTLLARPDVALLTLIDWEHTEGLEDLDGVEKEEREIFSTLGSHQVAVGYRGDPRVRRSLEATRTPQRLSYGFDAACDLRILSRTPLGPHSAHLSLGRTDGSTLSFSTSLIGRPGALACAAAVLGSEALVERAVRAEQCESAFRSAGEPGRHTLVELAGGRYVLDDSYNANPVSVEHSVATAREIADQLGGRVWLVLGEMLELGGFSRSAHEKVGELVAKSGAAGVFFVSGAARHAVETAKTGLEDVHFFEQSPEVVPMLLERVQACDVVLLKASRGVRVERVLEGLAAYWPRQERGTPKSSPSDARNSDS